MKADATITEKTIKFEEKNDQSFTVCPLRYESIDKNEIINDHQYNECSYITLDRFETTIPLKKDAFTCLNVNIRSLSKNFDKLKECLKSINHDYTVIGLSETHVKGKPLEYYHLPGYKMEYENREAVEKEGSVYT